MSQLSIVVATLSASPAEDHHRQEERKTESICQTAL
jgi:hypothetical protein